jgi:hypothetical protein
MPKSFRVTRRTRRVDAAHAADFGAERPYGIAGTAYTAAMCAELEPFLIRKKNLRPDILITVRPIARSPESLATSVDKVMRRFARRWGRRYAVGPDREPLWLNFFISAGPCEARHASHAHINVSDELTSEDERDLAKLAGKSGLKLEFTGNSADWLAGKKGVEKHACKVGYNARHLRRTGSTYRISASDTPPWVRRSRARFAARQRL